MSCVSSTNPPPWPLHVRGEIGPRPPKFDSLYEGKYFYTNIFLRFEEVLTDSKIDMGQVHKVVLVGGSLRTN